MLGIPIQKNKNIAKPLAQQANGSQAAPAEKISPFAAPEATCACGGGCPSCRNKDSEQQLKGQLQEVISEPGAPLEQATSERMAHAFHPQQKQAPSSNHGPAIRHDAPMSISEPNDIEEIQAEKTTQSVLHRLTMGSEEPREKPANSFDNVRIHSDKRAADVADAANAQALTFGNHILFAKGRFNPGSISGNRVLAHELAHVTQPASASANTLHRLPSDAPTTDPATGVDIRSFSQLWEEFDQLRGKYPDQSAEAIALVPLLIARMITNDAFDHAGDLALWLIKHEQHELAIRALDQLEDAWWIRHVTGNITILTSGGFGVPTGPEQLIEAGEEQASEGNDELARKLLGVAHLMLQMMIAKIYEQDSNDRAEAEASGESGDNMIGLLRQSDLTKLTGLRSRILNVYPTLASEAHRIGDTEGEVDSMEQGERLADEIANIYTLSDMPDTSDMSAPVLAPAPRRSSPPRSSKPPDSATGSSADNMAPPAAKTPDASASTAPAPVAIPPPSSDRVVSGTPPFDGSTALALPANHYVYVKTERYAVSEVLSRATAWAQNLFGVKSSIVVGHVDEDAVIRYYAAALDEDLTETFPSANPMQAIAAKVSVTLESLPNNYDIMVIHVGNGVGFWPSKSRLLAYESIVKKQTQQWPGTQNLEPDQVHTEVFSEIDAMLPDVDKNREEIARRLSQLDSTAFATLSTDQRMSYLTILLDAWTYQAQERAVVEIMKSVTSQTELAAIIARLKETDHWDALIDDLDNELWSLLVVVGERFGKDDLTMGDVYHAMADAGLFTVGTPIPGLSIGPNGPEFGTDVFAQIEEAANSFVRFLEGMWDAIVMLVTHPDKIIEGVAQLAKMVITFKLAEMGYMPAMVMRQQILQQFGRQLSNGFKGVNVLGVSKKVIMRIKWSIIWEIASFFIGVGEVKAAMTAMGMSARVGAIAKFVRLLGFAGKAAEAEEVVGGVTRLAGILGRSSKILRTEEEVLVALSHLPEDEAIKLGKALEGLELKEGMTLAQLRSAHPELGELAAQSLQRAEVVHRLANKAGGFSDDVARLFSRLSGAGHDTVQLEKIIAHIPDGEGARFLKTMSMITDEAAIAGPQGLAKLEILAQSAEKMQAVERFGFKAVDALMEKAGRNAAETDKYLAALAAIEKEFPEASRATKMQEFVESIANKDADALAKLEQRVNPNAPKTPATTPKETPPATTAPKDTPPATTAPKDTPPATTAPKDTPPATTAPKDTPPATTAPKDTPPATTAPKDTPPATTAPKDTPPATTAPKDTPPATTAPKDTPPATTAPKDTPPATTAPKEVAKPQAPAELQKIGIDAEAPQVLNSSDFSRVQLKPGQDALYIVRDADGTVLKVGKTSESGIAARLRAYKKAERLEKRAIQVEVYPLKPNPEKAETFEAALRKKMEAEGQAMPWDNTGNRLGREGFGTPGEGIRVPGVSKEKFIELLTLHKGNRKKVGDALGIHPRTVGMWAQSYGIKTTSFK